MPCCLAVLALLAAAPTSGELEYRATSLIVDQMIFGERPPPTGDPALAAAARLLARRAFEPGTSEASDLMAIAEAVSASGGYDPLPRSVAIRGSPPDEALRSLAARAQLREHGGTHLGVGAVASDERAVMVALWAERRAKLRPFRRAYPGPARPSLCGELLGSFGAPELYLTSPDGKVAKLPLTVEGERSFCAVVPLAKAGRYTVELLARGPKGPEIAALFFADVGPVPSHPAAARHAEPKTVPEARAKLLERINALRAAYDALPVELDEKLSRVAQACAEEMASKAFFAHVSPGGLTLRARLRIAGYDFKLAGENLAVASGPLSAHFGIEHSPAHRSTLLDPNYTKVGIGVAFQEVGGQRQAIVAQVFASLPRESRVTVDLLGGSEGHVPDVRMVPGERSVDVSQVYAALDEKRAARKLPPLVRSAPLEAMALEQARHPLEVKPNGAFGPEVRIFAEQNGLSQVEVEMAVSQDLRSPGEAKAIQDPKKNRVGAAAVREGEGYRVVVMYAVAAD